MKKANIKVTSVTGGQRGSTISFTIFDGTTEGAKTYTVALDGGSLVRVALTALSSTDKKAEIEYAEPRSTGCCCCDTVCIDYIGKITYPAPPPPS